MAEAPVSPYQPSLKCDPLVFAFAQCVDEVLNVCQPDGLLFSETACCAQIGKAASTLLFQPDLELDEDTKTKLREGSFESFAKQDMEWFFQTGDHYASETELMNIFPEGIDMFMITVCRKVAIHLKKSNQTSYTLLYALTTGSFENRGSLFKGHLLHTPQSPDTYNEYLSSLKVSDDIHDRFEYGLHYALAYMAGNVVSFISEHGRPSELDGGVGRWVLDKCLAPLFQGSTETPATLRTVLPLLYAKLPSYIENYIASPVTGVHAPDQYDPITQQKLMAIATITYTDPYFKTGKNECMEYITTIKWMGGGTSLDSKKMPLQSHIENAEKTYEEMSDAVSSLRRGLLEQIAEFNTQIQKERSEASRLFHSITTHISEINNTATTLSTNIQEEISRKFADDKGKDMIQGLFKNTEPEEPPGDDSNSEDENEVDPARLRQETRETLRNLLENTHRRVSTHLEDGDTDAELEYGEEEIPGDTHLVSDTDSYFDGTEEGRTRMEEADELNHRAMTVEWNAHSETIEYETVKLCFETNDIPKLIDGTFHHTSWTRAVMSLVHQHNGDLSLAPKVPSVNKVFYYMWHKIIQAMAAVTGTSYCILVVFLHENGRQVGSFPVLYSTDPTNTWTSALARHDSMGVNTEAIKAYIPYVDINMNNDSASTLLCSVLESLFKTDNDLKQFLGADWNGFMNAGPQVYERGYFQYINNAVQINRYDPSDDISSNDSAEFLQHVPFIAHIVEHENEFYPVAKEHLQKLQDISLRATDVVQMHRFKQSFYQVNDDDTIQPNTQNLWSQYVSFHFQE